MSLGNLDITGGTLAAEGAVAVTGVANWTGGTLSSNTAGTAGPIAIQPGSRMAISGASTKFISGPFLIENKGDSIVSSGSGAASMTSTVGFPSAGGITNRFGGLVRWSGDAPLTCNNGGSTCALTNVFGATLRRSTSTNPAVGKVATIGTPIGHITYKSLPQYIHKQNLYSSISAQEKEKTGEAGKISPFMIVLKTAEKFVEAYIIKRGFLDGFHGLIAAIGATCAAFFKHARTWELTCTTKHTVP